MLGSTALFHVVLISDDDDGFELETLGSLDDGTELADVVRVGVASQNVNSFRRDVAKAIWSSFDRPFNRSLISNLLGFCDCRLELHAETPRSTWSKKICSFLLFLFPFSCRFAHHQDPIPSEVAGVGSRNLLNTKHVNNSPVY